MQNFLLDFDLGSMLGDFFNKYIGMALYYVSWAMCKLVELFESLFNIFSGTQKVQYNVQSSGVTRDYLINIFFQNSTVNGLYWAMALLGMVLVFGFSIVAVARKTFDLRDRQQGQTLGSILGNMVKALLIMVSMTFIMTASITLSNELTASIDYAFDHADSFSHAGEIHYTDEQFATMARVFKTIGNYSLNPSYNSRYNLNSCFNDIRIDLKYLEDQGVFDFVYLDSEKTIDPTTNEVKEVKKHTWQSVLQRIVNSSDLSHELPIDQEYADVENALLEAMTVLKTDASFKPLQEYKRQYVAQESKGMDRIIFLTGTANSARNSNFNKKPFLTDGLRGAFYTGDKSIYSYDDVNEAFDTGITGLNNILIWVLAFLTARALFRCILACVSRIFNMLGLYLIAPFTIATMPLDDGAKFKQWITSVVVQMLGIFGYIIPMRLVLLFAPIVMSNKLVLSDNGFQNFVAKAVLIVAGVLAVQEFSQIINGILADNAGMASLHSGEKLQKAGMKGFDFVSKWGGIIGGATAAAPVGLAAWGVGAGIYQGGKAIIRKGKEVAGRGHDAAHGNKNYKTDKQSSGEKAEDGEKSTTATNEGSNQKNLSGIGSEKDNNTGNNSQSNAQNVDQNGTSGAADSEQKNLSSQGGDKDKNLNPGGDSTNPGNGTSIQGGSPSNLGGNPSKQGGSPSNLGGNPSKQGGSPSNLGVNPSKQGGSPSNLGVNPSKQGGSPSNLGVNPSKQGGSPSNLGVNPSKQGGSPSNLGVNPSKQGGSPSNLGGNLSQQSGNSSNLDVNPSKQGGSPSNLGGNLSQQSGNSSNLGVNPSKQGGSPSNLGGNLPKQGGSPSSLGVNPSKQGGSPSNLGGNLPQQGGNSSNLGGNPTNLGGNVGVSGGNHDQTNVNSGMENLFGKDWNSKYAEAQKKQTGQNPGSSVQPNPTNTNPQQSNTATATVSVAGLDVAKVKVDMPQNQQMPNPQGAQPPLKNPPPPMNLPPQPKPQTTYQNKSGK